MGHLLPAFAVSELVATLGRKFILFTPTSRMMDVSYLQMLARVQAECFPLDTNVILSRNGTLHPTKTPDELFARFTPQSKELDRSIAERAFALIQKLDTKVFQKPPSVLTVFRLYCIEELSADQIAKKFQCSKLTILRRLKLVRSKTGADPRDLRRFSTHLEKFRSSGHE